MRFLKFNRQLLKFRNTEQCVKSRPTRSGPLSPKINPPLPTMRENGDREGASQTPLPWPTQTALLANFLNWYGYVKSRLRFLPETALV